MTFLGMFHNRSGLKPTLFLVLFLSSSINGVLSRTQQDKAQQGPLLVPDLPDESHKISSNESHRYKIVSFNFSHVEVPYVICLWILLASIAKIGE